MKRVDQKLIEKFDDMISEKKVMELTGYSKRTLLRLRKAKKLTNVGSINGRKFQYSKSEIVTLFRMHMNGVIGAIPLLSLT